MLLLIYEWKLMLEIEGLIKEDNGTLRHRCAAGPKRA